MMKRIILFILVALCCTACQTILPRVKQPLKDEGELVLYMQPFPKEAQRLGFTIDAISAVREDGTPFPVSLRLAEFSAATASRQRQLGSALLPEGRYRGLSFRVKRATLKTEEGEAALLLPEQETVIDFPFEVKKREALLITLTLRYREAVGDGFHFMPALVPFFPPQPLPTLVGYVSNSGANTITVFDKKAGEAARVIATGRKPAGMALDSNRKRLYVALSGEDAVEVVDTATDRIIGRIRLNMGDAPAELALTPDGQTLLCINSGSNTVSVLDPLSLIEVGRVAVGNEPRSMVMDATGKQAFVFNYLANSMTIVDIGARTATTSIATEGGPLRGAMNRRGDRLMVIHALSPFLLVIDPATLGTVKRINVGIGASAIKVDTATDRFYVGKKFDSVVDVFDPFSLLASDGIQLAGWPTHLAIDNELNHLLAVLPDRRTLQIVNLVSRQPVAEIDTGDDPYWVTLTGER